MSDTRYFALRGEHGVDHADNPEPIREVGLSIPVPVMAGDQLVETTHAVTLQPAQSLGDAPGRVIPGTRFLEVQDPVIAAAVESTNLFDEIDEPKKADLDKARRDTTAHEAAMSARDQQVQAGNEPAPDATDHDNAAGDGQEG